MIGSSKEGCPHCKTKAIYHERFDCYYCQLCNVWLEGECEDKACWYCKIRPAFPNMLATNKGDKNMSELYFATKKDETYKGQSVNAVKFVESAVGAAIALKEGWRVYRLPAVELFEPEVTFSETPAIEKKD